MGILLTRCVGRDGVALTTSYSSAALMMSVAMARIATSKVSAEIRISSAELMM